MIERTGTTLSTVAVALALLAAAPAGSAQDRAAGPPRPGDTLVVVPGPRHVPGGEMRTALLGRTYRDLWATPIEARVLDLDAFAGGLEPMRRGGGQQTRVLHVRGADQRRYVFRSVDKRPLLGDAPPLRGTLVGGFIHTLPAHLHPGAAPVVASLLDAVDVLHVTPEYFVMPDDPRLGEFREEFGGMLGMIEERPNELEDDEPGFAGFRKIVGTETLRNRLEEGPEHRVDAREFLKARIVDLLVGDWDRHADQWRWGRAEQDDGTTLWRPIPRDRDHAFVDHDGAVIALGRRLFFPKAVAFRPQIDDIFGLTVNARDLDRELLAELPRETFDSMAAHVQARLHDDVLDRAVRRQPGPLHEVQGAELAERLRSRRASLPEAVREWYDQLSELVTIHATDEPERAEVERRPDALVVRLYAEEAEAPYFDRTMPLDEIGEVRIFLRGGDDRLVMRGEVERGGLVRVIGGGGDDVLVDSSRVARAGRRATLHDDRGENRIVAGPNTRVDRHRYDAPDRELTGFADVLPPDYGSGLRFAPALDYRGSVGLVLGASAVHTRQGFRHSPYAHRLALQGVYATRERGFMLEATGDFPRRHRPGLAFRARASQIERYRFFGFGNETAPAGRTSDFEVERDELLLEGSVYHEPAPGVVVSAGPVLRWGRSMPAPGSPLAELRPYGSGTFGEFGAGTGLRLDRRDEALRPRSGFLVTSAATAYPPVWDVREPFVRGALEGRAYLPLPLAPGPTLALRAGGAKLWGDFPVHDAAFIGGSATVRGYPYQRYAGDASAYGSAELRTPLSRANLLLVRPEVGLILLGDAGRVYARGETPGPWHTAAGAGLWFEMTVKGQLMAMSTTWARGSTDQVYLKLGMPF